MRPDQLASAPRPGAHLPRARLQTTHANRVASISLASSPADQSALCTLALTAAITDNYASQHGGLAISSRSSRTTHILLEASTVERNQGGGLTVTGGIVQFSNRTSLDANTPSNYRLDGGLVSYLLPAPPGTWLPNADCSVAREPCPVNILTGLALDASCAASSRACSVTADEGGVTASVPASACDPPAACNLGSCPGGTCACQPARPNHPCDWQALPELLGKFVHTLTVPSTTSQRFPFPCSAGLLGSPAPSHQTSPFCAGVCPERFRCPTQATSTPLPCTAGGYCPPGTIKALPCPAGTTSNRTNLASAAECERTLPGFAAPLGSITPRGCKPGTYADRGGLSACRPCASGTFQDAAESTACRACERGGYCPGGATSTLPVRHFALTASHGATGLHASCVTQRHHTANAEPLVHRLIHVCSHSVRVAPSQACPASRRRRNAALHHAGTLRRQAASRLAPALRARFPIWTGKTRAVRVLREHTRTFRGSHSARGAKSDPTVQWAPQTLSAARVEHASRMQ